MEILATKKPRKRGFINELCLEVEVGFEPTNDGFANRCLRPLGYSTFGCR